MEQSELMNTNQFKTQFESTLIYIELVHNRVGSRFRDEIKVSFQTGWDSFFEPLQEGAPLEETIILAVKAALHKMGKDVNSQIFGGRHQETGIYTFVVISKGELLERLL